MLNAYLLVSLLAVRWIIPLRQEPRREARSRWFNMWNIQHLTLHARLGFTGGIKFWMEIFPSAWKIGNCAIVQFHIVPD